MGELSGEDNTIRAVVKEVRAELATYLYEAQELRGSVRPLLAPGTRGELKLSVLRRLCAAVGIQPHLCPGAACPRCVEPETSALPCGCPARTFSQRAADTLADEVAVLVRRRVIDARSPAGDALLDYREPPSTPRADRLAELERRAVDAEQLVAAFMEHVAPERGVAGIPTVQGARALLRDLASARALKIAVKEHVPDWDAGEEPAGVVAHLVERLAELSRELAPLAALRARLKVLENECATLRHGRHDERVPAAIPPERERA